MWRGSAVEAGIINWLGSQSMDLALKAAFAKFEEEAQGEVSDDIEKELEVIPGMVKQGTLALAGWTRPEPGDTQVEVKHWFDGIGIPIKGYIDALWPERGLEIKSTNRMGSEISAEHASQTAFYSICKKRPFDVLYVSKNKWNLFRLENAEAHLKRLEWAAHAVQDLLTAFPDPLAATRILPAPDYDHPYLWKSEAARTAAAQIWR